MKSYSILRLQCNPSLNGFPQITACSSIKSVSHCKLPTVSVSQLGYIYECVCVFARICEHDLSMTGDLYALSLSDKSLQRPRVQGGIG